MTVFHVAIVRERRNEVTRWDLIDAGDGRAEWHQLGDKPRPIKIVAGAVIDLMQKTGCTDLTV